ncbi:MAG: hypothetical protein ACK5MF_06305 [Vibrio sp.]|uniref:hypothetical protein n=1 Tax=Vibrio sp. TaxID=678 RepID=UPI003A8897FE
MTSLTGFLGKARNVARFENELQTQQGSLYYALDVGFDYQYWDIPGAEFSVDAFNTWIIDESIKRSIFILKSSIDVSDFTLKLSYSIAGTEGQQTFSSAYV